MRCNNCGWDNPAGLTSCQKCNQPLEFTPIQQQPVVNTRATMVDIQQEVSNPRATMADVQQTVSNPRATMVDDQQPVINPRATMVDIPKKENTITLTCIDNPGIGEIQITTSSDIGLAAGDMIFIKNYRYQAK